ncbi:hypothetical protein BH20ACI1_BH20ACI1_16340 [soil metagenome]
MILKLAIASNANSIVTFNLKDFENTEHLALKPFRHLIFWK